MIFLKRMCCVLLCCVSSGLIAAETSPPKAAPIEVISEYVASFEQRRLKLAFKLPPKLSFKRKEDPAYDELVLTLPEGRGSLSLWTYSRQLYTPAKVLASVQKENNLQSPTIERLVIASMPALLVRGAAAAEQTRGAEPNVHLVLNRAGFDWIYRFEIEANRKEDQALLWSLLNSMTLL